MNDIELYRGDTSGWVKLAVTDEDDAAVDLSGATVKVTVKKFKSDTLEDAVIAINSTDDSTQFNLTGLALGFIYFKFIPADTLTLDPGNYYYDIEVTDGTDVYTFPDADDNARVIIKEDVTTPAAAE